jgi:hypothetical protein
VTSIEKADTELHKALTGYHRLRWLSLGVLAALLVMVGTVGAMVIYHQQEQLDGQQAELASACQFFTDLAKLPVGPAPGAKAPAAVGVLIVADSRVAAFGLGCPHIAPASPSLKKWAAYYHIPLRLSS